MDKNEAERLAVVLHRERPAIRAQAWLNEMTGKYEVSVNGGDPRGVRVWLDTPRQVMRYARWLASRSE